MQWPALVGYADAQPARRTTKEAPAAAGASLNSNYVHNNYVLASTYLISSWLASPKWSDDQRPFA
jgi:hypothetical protein